jgi:transcriptional regulator with XRE-family HTH domain
MEESSLLVASDSGLGRAIELRRVHRGWKRKDLSAASGLSYPFISEIENGTKEPSSKSLRQIAGALELSVLELHQLAADCSDEVVEQANWGSLTSKALRNVRVHRSSPASSSPAPAVTDLILSTSSVPPEEPMMGRPFQQRAGEHKGLSEDAIREIIRAELEKWTSDQLPSLVRRELQRALADMATPRDPNS